MVANDRHAGRLPWGWWLRAKGHALEDEQGRKWDSVRDAFWNGELRFPDIHVAPEQHELLLRVLTAIDGHWYGAGERRTDIFDGDPLFWRFYMCWLASVGLTQADRANGSGFRMNALEAPLTDEGRSVMMMLQATRDPAFEPLPMAEVVDAIVSASNGPAERDREAALRAFEREVVGRRHVFAREDVGSSRLVTLTGIGSGPGARMPVRRVVWSQSFPDARARDDLFAWLATRVARWDDWGDMAYRRGADALTAHLFALHVTASGDQS